MEREGDWTVLPKCLPGLSIRLSVCLENEWPLVLALSSPSPGLLVGP